MFDAKMIGQRIKVIRGQQSQQEFADLLNIGRASLARYEVGDRPPDLEFAYKTYVICGVNPLWLMTVETEQSPLPSEEQLLLSRFRTSPQLVKAAALRVVLGVIVNPATSQTISGDGNRVAFGNYHEVKDGENK